jgi:hypothetical protein
MKSLLVFAAFFAVSAVHAQRPPRVEGREGERIIIRVDENDRQDRNQNLRIRELEKAVRDLQYRVYDLEDKVNGNRPPVRPIGPTCNLLGAGAYAGMSYNYRVAVDGNILSGHYGIQDALNSIEKFKTGRVCSVDSMNAQCNLLGAGAYAGMSYSYRVGIKDLITGQNEVVSGHYGQQDALSMMAKLRQASLCQ